MHLFLHMHMLYLNVVRFKLLCSNMRRQKMKQTDNVLKHVQEFIPI